MSFGAYAASLAGGSPAVDPLSAETLHNISIILILFYLNPLPSGPARNTMSPCYLQVVMATLAQIQANRRNAQKSTGPKSEAGKIVTSQNACKSGVYAEAPLIDGEDPAAFDALALSYRDTYAPIGPAE